MMLPRTASLFLASVLTPILAAGPAWSAAPSAPSAAGESALGAVMGAASQVGSKLLGSAPGTKTPDPASSAPAALPEKMGAETPSAAAPTGSTASTGPQAMTLGEVIAYAYETNPGLQAQRAAQRALDENYVQARGAYGLSAQGQASLNTYDFQQGASPGFLGENPPTHSITDYNQEGIAVSQPLYTGGRARAHMTEAEAQVLAGREQLRKYEIDLLTRVVTAYMSVRRDQNLLEIARETVRILEKQLHDVKARQAVRELTMTDVEQAAARVAQAHTGVINAEAQLAISRSEFYSVVGQNPINLAPPPDFKVPAKGIDEAFDAAEANNPNLQQARYTELLSRAQIAEAKAGRLPTVTAQFNLQNGPYVPYQRLPYDVTKVGSIVVQQPLFAGGQIQSAIRQATQANNRDKLTISDTRLQVVQAVSADWERLMAFRRQLTTLSDQYEADKKAYAGITKEQAFDLRSTIDVLNQELELTTAEQTLAQTEAAEYVARIQLLDDMGVLNARLLAPGVNLYDPAKNFHRVANVGATPLEIPLRAVEALTGPPLKPLAPAKLGQDLPPGAPAVPPPPPAELTGDAPVPAHSADPG